MSDSNQGLIIAIIAAIGLGGALYYFATRPTEPEEVPTQTTTDMLAGETKGIVADVNRAVVSLFATFDTITYYMTTIISQYIPSLKPFMDQIYFLVVNIDVAMAGIITSLFGIAYTAIDQGSDFAKTFIVPTAKSIVQITKVTIDSLAACASGIPELADTLSSLSDTVGSIGQGAPISEGTPDLYGALQSSRETLDWLSTLPGVGPMTRQTMNTIMGVVERAATSQKPVVLPEPVPIGGN